MWIYREERRMRETVIFFLVISSLHKLNSLRKEFFSVPISIVQIKLVLLIDYIFCKINFMK
jgi:hypothetical protein